MHACQNRSASQSPFPPSDGRVRYGMAPAATAACATAAADGSPPLAPTHGEDEVRELAALAQQAVAGLRAAGTRLVCIDFDATFLTIHTGGAWSRSVRELRPHVRGFFLALVPLLTLAEGIQVALVTFSPQESLVSELLALCFPRDVADAVIVRADSTSWSVTSDDAAQFMPLWQTGGRHLDRRFKLPFLVSAAQQASSGSGQKERVRNRDTVLIDDDAANVHVARDCGVLALFFDAEAAKSDPRAAERAFCAGILRVCCSSQANEDERGGGDAGEDSPSLVRSPSVASRAVATTVATTTSPAPTSTPGTTVAADGAATAATPVVTPDKTPPRPPTGRASSIRASSSIRRQWARGNGSCSRTPGSVPSAAKSTPDRSRRRVGRVLRDILNTTAASSTPATSTNNAKADLPAVVRLSATPNTKFLVSGSRSTSSAPSTSSRATSSSSSSSRGSRFHMCTPSPVLKLKYTVDMGRPRSKRASRLMRNCTRSIDGELRGLQQQQQVPPQSSALSRDGPPSALPSPASSPPSAARTMQPLFEAASPSPPASQ